MTVPALNEPHEGHASADGAAVATAGKSVNEAVGEIVRDLGRFPNPEFLPLHENHLGSTYVAFEASPDVVNALAGQDIITAFRRVVLDPLRGFIMLMSPSIEHEDLTEELDAATKEVAAQLRKKKRNLRQNRWKPKGGGKNTGEEADNCYYFDSKVDNYDKAYEEGEHVGYAGRTPPDLVVEVTVSHFDDKKIDAWRALKADEYWQVKGTGKQIAEVSFLALQAQPEPAALRASAVLDGFTPAALLDCLKHRSSSYADPADYGRAIRQVLIDHGIIPGGDEGNDGGGSPQPASPR